MSRHDDNGMWNSDKSVALLDFNPIQNAYDVLGGVIGIKPFL